MGLWLDRGRECDNLRQAIEIQINHYLCGTDNPVSVALNTPLDRPIDRALRGFFIQFCYPSVTRTSKCRSLVANKPICNSELQPILERSHRFCIEKEGSVSNILVLQSPDKLLADEALRVIASSPAGAWTPGEQRGEKVRVKYTLPVDFYLQGSGDKLSERPEKPQGSLDGILVVGYGATQK